MQRPMTRKLYDNTSKVRVYPIIQRPMTRKLYDNTSTLRVLTVKGLYSLIQYARTFDKGFCILRFTSNGWVPKDPESGNHVLYPGCWNNWYNID